MEEPAANIALSEPPAPLPAPGTLGSLRPPALNLVLFAATFLSAGLAGAIFTDTQLPKPTPPEMLQHGVAFSVALIAILLSHEMGHFLYARRHGVDATWPFFIPAPLLSLIGTLGAVIRLRSLPRTRAALVDIGASGPLFGFAVTLPVLAIGLWLSPHVPREAEPQYWTLWRAASALAQTGHWLPTRDGFDLGEPLAIRLLQALVVRDLQPGQTLALHPVAIAGWFGLLLTALNLLPLGQLDGGHCVHAASPRLHRAIGAPISALLLGLGVFTPFVGWALWGLLTGLWLNRHPPLAEPEERLDGKRRLVLAVTLVVFVLSFAPVPLAPISG